MSKEEILQKCTVVGNVVKLPDEQLDRKLYLEVSKSLEFIGGKWKGGKIMGFVFNTDPTDLLSEISTGEKRNLKKEFQFFETPTELAEELVQLANIQVNDSILEPSAGQGAIVKVILRNMKSVFGYKTNTVFGYELSDINQIFLNKISGFVLYGNDFLTECNLKFDKIIANPPFSGNQDIDHILKMYESLEIGGRLVTVSSRHWMISNNKKETEFRNWLNKVNAEIKNVPAGTFKESGTNIPTTIIIINK